MDENERLKNERRTFLEETNNELFARHVVRLAHDSGMSLEQSIQAAFQTELWQNILNLVDPYWYLDSETIYRLTVDELQDLGIVAVPIPSTNPAEV
ncbi:MAG: hypothetical protein LBR39_00430 [Coriobacteriales bacterium]|nr:hypothetical protein [Coriobacteriales bacterium]